MARRKYHLHEGKGGAALAVRVTPRAGRNRVTEVLADGTVKIQLAAAPVEGEANASLVDFLSEVLDVAKSRIEIVGGLTGRDKLVSIVGLDARTLQQRILSSIQ